MILVGAGANRKRVAKYLSKLVTKYHIPFFASQMGKGVLDEGMDEYIGTAALTSDDRLHPVIKQSDLIIAIGHDTIEKPTNIIQDGSTQVIHINFTPAHIDQLYVPTMQVIGDIGNTLRQLCESDIDSSGRDFDNIYALSTHQRQVKQDYEQTLIRDDIMTPVPLVRMIREALADEDIVSLDNGLYKVRFARNYETRAANTLLLDNALATMGA
jgi:acetolactate synthase-1/2/3 large subunit